LRGEEKTHIQKGSAGEKNKVITDEFSSPLFDQRFVFEMLINFECVARKNEESGLMEGGYAIPRKITHPSVASFLPKENEQIGVEFGEKLAAWCSVAGNPNPQPVKKPLSERDRLAIELWKLLSTKVPGLTKDTKDLANQFLWDNDLLDGANPDHTLDKLSEVQLRAIIEQVKGMK
jgi:hypothetical protein